MTDYTIPSAHVNGPAGQTHPQQSPIHEWDANSHDGTPYIIVDGQRNPLTGILDAGDLHVLQQQLQAATLISINLGNLPSLSRSQQTVIGHICKAVRGRGRFLTPDGSLLASPLAALAQGATELDDQSKEQFIATAIQLAAAWSPDDVDAAVVEVTAAFNAAKVRKPRDLAKKIKHAARRLQASEHECQRIIDLIVSPETDPDLFVPRNWIFDPRRNCLVRIMGPVRGEEEDSLPGLLFVTEECKVHSTGQLRLQLRWSIHGEIRAYSVQRQQLLTTRRAEELSALGLPTSSMNSKLFVAYFADFLRENDFRLHSRRLVNQMGWVSDAVVPAFVFGNQVLRPSDATPSDESIELDCDDPAVKQFASAYRRSGESEVSHQLFREVAEHPMIWITVLAALSSVLLRPLRLPGFTIDLCGESTSAKTTVLLICASLFGDPDPDGSSESTIWHSWDLTRVFSERWLSVLRSLPALLDDTRQVAKPEIVGHVIYDITNGTNKGRGNEKSVDVQLNWRLNAISTGERSLVSFVDQGGMRARIITLRGSLLPERNEEWRVRVENWISTAFTNFGHLGPQFIQHVLDNYRSVPDWKERIDELKRQLSPTFAANAIAGRQLNHFALLTLTAELCCDWFGFPDHLRTPVEAIRPLLQVELADADRPLEAMQRLLDYVTANPQLVAGVSGYISDVSPGMPPRASTHLGRWVVIAGDRGTGSESLAIFSDQFGPFMEQHGFSSDEVLTSWKQRGWLHLEAGGRVLKNVRFNLTSQGTQTVRAVCISAATIRQMRASRQVSGEEGEDPAVPGRSSHSGNVPCDGNTLTSSNCAS